MKKPTKRHLAGPDLKFIKNELERSGYIRKFRLRWNMPLNGFKDIAEYRKWYLTDFAKMYQNHKAKSKPKNHDNLSFFEKQISTDLRFVFELDIYDKLVKLRLAEHFLEYVQLCLLLTELPEQISVELPKPTVKLIHKENGLREVWVQVFSHTTKKEWQSPQLWSLIDQNKRNLLDFKTPTKEIHDFLYRGHYGSKFKYKKLIKLAQDMYGYKIKNPVYLGQVLDRYKKRIKRNKAYEKPKNTYKKIK